MHFRPAVAVATALALLIGFVSPVGSFADEPPPDAALAGHWEGAVDLPSVSLTMLVDLALKDNAWSGTIDIPPQGATGLPLTGVRAVGDSVVFAIAGVPGAPTFRGMRADATIAGTFTQNGMSFPFHFGREKIAAPARPQEPKRPFPYREEEVGYENGAVHLAATLTLPEGQGPFPAAVLITGSGAQNRDEELLGHKPFLVLSDFLTRAGIAVLRADDRGVGGSTGKVRNSTSSDFADDALAGVRFLRTRAEIDPRRIGLIGHSEGGIVGPIAAARAPDRIAFLVMIAGTGVPLDEVVLRQSYLIARASGVDSTMIALDLAKTRLVLERVKAGADSAAVRADLEALVKAQIAALPEAQRPSPQEMEAQVDAELARMISPWFRWAAGFDPRPTLRQVRCPVFAVNGGLDLQVDPEQNLPPIEQALREGGNRDVTILRLPGLNHLLQQAKSGSPDEYATIEETMNPAGLTAIRDWVTVRCTKGR